MNVTMHMSSGGARPVYCRFSLKDIWLLIEYKEDPGNDSVEALWQDVEAQWKMGSSLEQATCAKLRDHHCEGLVFAGRRGGTLSVAQKGSVRVYRNRDEATLLIGESELSHLNTELEVGDRILLATVDIWSVLGELGIAQLIKAFNPDAPLKHRLPRPASIADGTLMILDVDV